jgi:hypothetical protein
MSTITVSPVMTSAPRLRITRRGRAVVAALIAGPVAVAIAAFALDGGAVATVESSDASFTYVSVAAGETLWDIASSVAPESDPREVVADITRLNNLSGSVQPGERLAIPAEYVD